MEFGREQLIRWGVTAFATVFFGVGVYRVVEFRGIGLSEGKKRLFMGLHVIGCALFAAALIAAIYELGDRKLMFGLFIGALAALAPGQFAIGMKIKSRASSQPGRGPRR